MCEHLILKMIKSPEFEKFLNKSKNENIFNSSESDANIKKKMWEVISEDSNLCIRMGKVFCIPCEYYFETFTAKHGKQTVHEHVNNSAKHKANVCENPNKRKSTEDLTKITIHTKGYASKDFWTDLCKAFMCADIPLEKLKNEVLIKFLKDYTKRNIPHPTTLRNEYVDPIYEDMMDKIRKTIGTDDLGMMFDETTDISQNTVFNLLVFSLNGKEIEPCLVSSQNLKSTKASDIKSAVKKGLKSLFPEGIPFNRIKLAVTDGAHTMEAAVKELKSEFPNLKHVKCLAHALSLVCETVRQKNELADEFISNMKKLLLNSPKRIHFWKQFCQIPLPSQPVITRWGTWLNVAYYYVNNFKIIKEFLFKLNDKIKKEEKKVIPVLEKLIKLIENPKLQNEMTELLKFKILTDRIKKIESKTLTLRQQLEMISELKIKLPDYAKAKLVKCVRKNPDLEYFENTSNPNEFYAPLTTVAAERSFSVYKSFYSDRRTNMTEKNKEMFYLVLYNRFLYY